MAVRWATKDERELLFPDCLTPFVVIDLPDHTLLFASADEEQNYPGVLMRHDPASGFSAQVRPPKKKGGARAPKVKVDLDRPEDR
jgi:hypothetical protein